MKKRSFSDIRKDPKVNFYSGLVTVNILATGFIFGFLNPGDMDTDGGMFAAIAYKDTHGGTLYVDAWENKPPGIYYFLELFFTLIPHKVYALYIFSISGILTLVNGIYFTAHILLRSAFLSLLVLISFILIAINNYFMSDGLYTEIFGSAFIVWSLYAYHKFCDSSNARYAFVSAFLCGTAVWFKEPFLFLSIPIAIILAIQLKQGKLILKMFLAMGLPSLLFVLILSAGGSLEGFVEMEISNFRLSGTKGEVISSNHLQVLWGGVLNPLPIIWLIIVVYGLKCAMKKGLALITIFNCSLLAGGLCFIFISPASYGHYYLPFTAILFYSLVSFLHYGKLQYRSSRIIITLLLVYSAWKLDQDYVRGFKTSFTAYRPDSITQILRRDSSATLFIDVAFASEYYIKSEKKFPALFAVPIEVHFSDNVQGPIRLKRMYEELKAIQPDYLITNESTSEMYRRFPDQTFYSSNYERKDSVLKGGGKIILWKHKKTDKL